MTVPEIVESALGGEEIAARVSLGGDDELFVSPSCTFVYRSDGLLSDESVEEFPHEANRLVISEGRRKTRLSLEYPLGETREFTVPASTAEAALHSVVAGVLTGNGITDPGESVIQTYRFSELTVVLTSDRLVKHIGEAVWDADFEQYHFGDVTDLAAEDGSVATQIVLSVDGRPQRIKAPNEHAEDLRGRLERALLAYHDVDSVDELGDEDDDGARESDPASAFGEGVDPLDAGSPSYEEPDQPPVGSERKDAHGTESTALDDGETAAVGATRGGDPTNVDASTEGTGSVGPGVGGESTAPVDDESTAAFEESGFQPATATDPELLERIEALETAVERQSDLLRRQGALLDQLIEELRAGR